VLNAQSCSGPRLDWFQRGRRIPSSASVAFVSNITSDPSTTSFGESRTSLARSSETRTAKNRIRGQQHQHCVKLSLAASSVPVMHVEELRAVNSHLQLFSLTWIPLRVLS